MKSFVQILISISFLAFLSACAPYDPKNESTANGSGEISGQGKISSFEHTLNSLGRIEAAVALLRNEKTDLSNDEVAQLFRDKMNAQDCSISYNKATVTQGSRKSSLLITGEKCPLSANYSIIFQLQNSGLMTFDMKASFLITDPVLVVKNEIYQMSVQGSGTIKSKDDKITTSLDYSGTAKISGKDSVTFSYREVDNESSLDPSFQASGNTTFTINFPAKAKASAYKMELKKLKVISSGKDKSTYFLNNSAIDRASFEIYLGKFGMLDIFEQ